MRPRFILTIFLLSFFAPQNASSQIDLQYANVLGEPHYMKGGVFVFDYHPNPNPIFRGRVIMSYLPYGTLVFPVPLNRNDLPRKLNHRKFGTYITQFGQVAIIKRDSVSKRPITAAYNKETILFHRDSFICSVEGVTNCVEDDGIPIPTSWAGSISLRDSNFIIEFFDDDAGERIQGKLSKERLEELKTVGVVTDLREPWPRYMFLEKQEIRSMSKHCGSTDYTVNTQTLKAELGLKGDVGFLNFMSGIFSLNYSEEEERESKTLIGSADEAIYRYKISIAQPSDTGEFSDDGIEQMYVTASYNCSGISADSQPYHMKELVFVAPKILPGRYTIKWPDIYRKQLSTDDAEFIVNNARGKRFLFSINSKSAYERALSALQSETNMDIALANIFISLFNASCESTRDARIECDKKLN